MYEAHHEKLLPTKKFLTRLINNILIGILIIAVSLATGMSGYHYYEDMSWMDSYLNAAMILSGMGPISALHSEAGKAFAGTYALFSGIVFLIVMAIIFAPIFHRFFHKFHLQEK